LARGPSKCAPAGRRAPGPSWSFRPWAGSAKTHDAPLRLVATVRELDVQGLQRTLSTSDPDEALRRAVTVGVAPLLRRFAVRTLVFSGVVGVLMGLLIPHRRWPPVLLLGATWQTYDATAFERPRFDGPLEQAPDILRTIRRHVAAFDDLRGRVDVLSQQLTNLYEAATSPPQPARATRLSSTSATCT